MGLFFFLTTFIVAKKTDLRGFIPLNWINPKLAVVWSHSEVLFKTQNVLVNILYTTICTCVPLPHNILILTLT